MIVMGFNEPARELAKRLQSPYLPIQVRIFPDGEINPRLMFDAPSFSLAPNELRDSDVILAAWWDPKTLSINSYLMSILYVLKHVNQKFSPNKSILVLPYHVYARQDKEFRSGEIVSSYILSSLLEDCGMTHFVTVTSHLAREQPIYRLFTHVDAREISGIAVLAKELDKRIQTGEVDLEVADLLVIAPDHNALSWAQEFASIVGTRDVSYLMKKRDRDTGEIKQSLPEEAPSVEGKVVLLIDDIVSTGSTMYRAAQIFLEQGARCIGFSYVHAVHSTPDSVNRLKSLDPMVLMCTNSILIGSEYEMDKISLIPSLTDFLLGLLE